MFDGFDEITSSYKDLLQALRQKTVEQFWATTRPDLREELEEKLLQLPYIQQSFPGENVINFFKKKCWV